MKGISYLTDQDGQKKAIVIDFDLFKNRDTLLEIIEDIEDEISIDLRRDEPSFDWDQIRGQVISKD